MESIYRLQERAEFLRSKNQADSISPEEVGSLHADTLAYLADMEQNEKGLGIRKVYKNFSSMNADRLAPVGTNGKPLRFGQLVAVYDKDNPSQAENGNIYAYQKGAEEGWILMGNLNSYGEISEKIAGIKNYISRLDNKAREHDKALSKKANAEEVAKSLEELDKKMSGKYLPIEIETHQIKNGAVTPEKLSPDIIQGLEDRLQDSFVPITSLEIDDIFII